MARSQLRLFDRNRPTSDRVQVTVVTGPRITGTPANGQTLTATPTVAVGGPTIAEARQWFRNSTLIPGATGATFVLTATEVGTRISVRSTITQPRSRTRVVWSPQTAIVT